MFKVKQTQELHLGEDVIWKHRLPISLDFEESSRLVLVQQIKSLANIELMCSVDISNEGQPFSCLLPEKNFKRKHLFSHEPKYKYNSIGSAYYFPYKAGFDSNKDFIENIGNVEILVNPGSDEPHYVLTGAMNGCAIIITKEEGQKMMGRPSFRAWHFQSPTSNKTQLRAFINRYRNCIYSYICFQDYASPNNGSGYDEKDVEGFNYLFFNNAVFEGSLDGTWELNCIPLKRIPMPLPESEWKKSWVQKSRHCRSRRLIDFTKGPIIIPPDNAEGKCPVIDWIVWDITYAVEKPFEKRESEPVVEGRLPSGLPPEGSIRKGIKLRK
ncbi:hypothetical protein J2786_001657 [Chryseobacterium vietnamense]|uniref:Uncharacterized protein n=1 Tax=Chryseobacterium vietnamense TaxID=866785 RepID=A0ACC6J6U3_9FLAO|nr:hypothetical protein [Chryseobacterium vietnamense]MDR6458564.1 hypothetical protein [Chryseobacterium vietnamense]